MTSYIFDSYAVLALFRREKGHEIVTSLLTDIAAGKSTGYICTVNIGEVYYITARKQGKELAETALHALMHFPLERVPADLDLCLAAAEIKSRHLMSYADAFAAALTQQKKGILITGDKEFRTMEGEPNFKVKSI